MPIPVVTVTRDVILGRIEGTSTLRQNIVEAIDAIDPRDTPLLSTKGFSAEKGMAAAGADSLSKPCVQPTYTWQNDALIPLRTRVRTAYASGDVTIAVTTSTADYFRIDEILVATSANGTTHWRITAVDLTNDILSVTVLNNDQAHAVDTDIFSIGRPRVDGTQADVTGDVTTIGADDNYTEIFQDTASVTGTHMATESVGIANQLDYQVEKVLGQLILRLETNALYGLRSTALPTANTQPAKRMGGVDYYVRAFDTNGQTRNATGATLATSEDTLKRLLDDIYDVGGKPDTILVGLFQRAAISSFLAPFVRTDRTEGVAGVVAGEYEYSYGTLRVVLDRYVHRPHLWALTMEYFGVGPLRGNGEDRSFRWEEIPKNGDYYARFVTGEMTMELRNRTRAHGLLFNLAIS
mgnify:CR=1 FL=1